MSVTDVVLLHQLERLFATHHQPQDVHLHAKNKGQGQGQADKTRSIQNWTPCYTASARGSSPARQEPRSRSSGQNKVNPKLDSLLHIISPRTFTCTPRTEVKVKRTRHGQSKIQVDQSIIHNVAVLAKPCIFKIIVWRK